MNRFLQFVGVAVIAATVASFGCGGPKRLAGMPKLVSCALVLKQDGKPLADASVYLFAKDADCPWTVGGTTDASGVAKIKTHGQYPGAPLGTFVVVVEKTESTDDNQGEKATKPYEIYTLVDPKYADRSTSPLEVKIEKKTNEEFDLGPAARELLRKVDPNEF